MQLPELEPHDFLLRRLHPEKHVTVMDEATGERRLNWAALEFDDDGCSVYRDSILSMLGLTRVQIVEKPYTSIAETTKQRVEDHVFVHASKELHLFTAVAAPRTELPPLQTDPAHALVVVKPNDLSNKKLEKAQRRLAAAFEVVHHEQSA